MSSNKSYSLAPIVNGISSMATRLVLADLTAAFELETGIKVSIESVGGVDAARRIQTGEVFDIVILASDAIDSLIVSGSVLNGSKVDLLRSEVAIAVREGAPTPDISKEDKLRDAIRSARSIGFSTGPSGLALAALLKHWDLEKELETRIIKPAPGIPVGTLIAKGEVELGFQQFSELLPLAGITILGLMPPEISITTTFSAGTCTKAGNPEGVQTLINFLTSKNTSETIRRHGMEPA